MGLASQKLPYPRGGEWWARVQGMPLGSSYTVPRPPLPPLWPEGFLLLKRWGKILEWRCPRGREPCPALTSPEALPLATPIQQPPPPPPGLSQQADLASRSWTLLTWNPMNKSPRHR